LISVLQELGIGYIATRITKSMSSLGCWKPHYMGSRNSSLRKTKMRRVSLAVGTNRTGKVRKIKVVRKME
jgi:hypothetical protein